MIKLLDLKDDLVFQELFGKQKNSEITSHFLSLILGRKIENIDLDANKRMLGNGKDSKTERLDIRAKFNDGEDCNIELQVVEYEYMLERMLDYWGNMYSNKIKKSEKYNVLKPTISILIAAYKLKELKDISKYHTVWNLREKDYTDKILNKNIEIHILEIPKISDKNLKEEELANWLKFIENPESEDIKKIMNKNDFLKQAMDELAYLSGDEGFKDAVERRVDYLFYEELEKNARYEKGLAKGKEEGIKEGKRVGLEEGELIGKIKIVKEMLRLNIPMSQISKITKLTEEEIEEIKNKKNL